MSPRPLNMNSFSFFEKVYKVHIFWEGHKILQNFHQLFVLCIVSQIIGGDFSKFCGLLRIYELLKRNIIQVFALLKLLF